MIALINDRSLWYTWCVWRFTQRITDIFSRHTVSLKLSKYVIKLIYSIEYDNMMSQYIYYFSLLFAKILRSEKNLPLGLKVIVAKRPAQLYIKYFSCIFSLIIIKTLYKVRSIVLGFVTNFIRIYFYLF